MKIEQEHQITYTSPIKSVFEKFSRHKDVSLVYGEPIELDNMRVLPVAKVSYSGGGGGGYSEESEKSPASQGEGAGGHIVINPLGVYEITPERVRFKPAVEFRYVVLLVAVCTFGLAWVLKKR